MAGAAVSDLDGRAGRGVPPRATAGARTVTPSAFQAVAAGRRIRIAHIQEREINGQLFNFSTYGAIGTFFLVAVVDWNWQHRFLVATAFFFIVGLMALNDVFRANRIVYYAVETVDAGPPLRTVTASLGEAQSIAAAANQGLHPSPV